MAKEKLRIEIDNKYKWDLSAIYNDEDQFDKDYEYALKLIDEMKSFKGHLTESATVLYDYLTKDEELTTILNNLFLYASCKNDEDVSEKESQKRYSKVLEIYSTCNEKLSFVNPELLKTDYAVIRKFLTENASLNEYKIDLERIYRYQPYVLSEKEEKLLGNLSDIKTRFKNNFNIISNVLINLGYIRDEDGNKVKLTNGNFSKYIRSKDRNVRKQAHKNKGMAYKKYANLIATDYEGSIKTDSMISKARGYKSNIEMYLFDDGVTTEVYDNLLKVANDNLSTLHKYFDLKKDILKLDKLYPYDLSASMIDESKEKYSPSMARKIITEALSIYGDEYVNELNRLFDEKCIDFYPNKGKNSGFYENASSRKTVVFCNYNDDFYSMSSLAHELGHAMHSYYSRKNNKEHLAYYSILIAEIASLTNEILLSNYILNNTDDKKLKLQAIQNILEVFADNFYGTLCLGSVFEKIVHEKVSNGETLQEEDFNKIYQSLIKEHNGKNVKELSYTKYNWSRISHFYTPFYYYKYSIGICGACYVAKKILNGDGKFLNKYINFLKLGDSMMPLDELKTIGIDLSKPYAINEAINYFNELIDKFKELYNS